MVFSIFNFRGKTAQLMLLMCTFCFVQQSAAAEIIMEPYQYPSESAIHFSEREMFVICDCPEAQDLARHLVAPPLALKASSSKKGSSKTAVLKRSKVKSKPIKYTLSFGFDSDRLSPAALQKLNKVVQKIKSMPGRKRIAVLGYTCEIGPKIYNDRLSLRRAESVVRHLKAQGLPTLEAEGKGSCCPVSKKIGLNRRVEIRVEIIDPQGEQS